jgi:hypothetical protein
VNSQPVIACLRLPCLMNRERSSRFGLVIVSVNTGLTVVLLILSPDSEVWWQGAVAGYLT